MAVGIDISPQPVLVDQPVAIRLSGLLPGGQVTVRASASWFGQPWASAAAFSAGPDGVVDLGRDAPLSGSYAAPDGMGLFWSLMPQGQPDGAPAAPAVDPRAPLTVRLTVEVDGTAVASGSVERLFLGDGVTVTPVRDDGLVARFFRPAGDGPFPAVMVFTGSGGGFGGSTFQAALLATRGFAALALAYFRLDPLPRDLAEVPLEYFETAIGWLAARSDVRADAIAVMGPSRGGELALLLGATFPSVRAVVAYVPSHVVWPGIGATPGPPSGHVSWTWCGKPVPMMSPSAGPAAAMPAVAALMPVDTFAPRARHALAFAAEEARRSQQPAITPEHLFLGMLREGTGMVTAILTALEVDLEGARTAVEADLPHGESFGTGDIGVTPECRQVIEQAAAEAGTLEHRVIGQEHVLLAMLRLGGRVAGVLERYHVTYDAARGFLTPSQDGFRPTTPIALTPGFLAQLADEAAEARAAIPVERIRGPVLLISGKDDQMWPSALMAERVMERLAAHDHPYPDAHLCYEDAGHAIGIPYMPAMHTGGPHPVTGLIYAMGGSRAGTAFASADSWPRVPVFLAEGLAPRP